MPLITFTDAKRYWQRCFDDALFTKRADIQRRFIVSGKVVAQMAGHHTTRPSRLHSGQWQEEPEPYYAH